MWAAQRLVPLVLLASALASAQHSPENCSSPTLFANVFDRHGQPAQKLTSDNFRLKLGRNKVDIKSATFEVKPRRVVVVLDTSGSMAGNTGHAKWEIAREAARDILSVSTPELPIAFVMFSSAVIKEFGFKESRSGVPSWLDSFDNGKNGGPRGVTGLFDAISAAKQILGPAQEGDALYVITDGQDDHSSGKVKGLKKELMKSGVRVFAFWLYDQYGFGFMEQQEGDFADLVTDTGGWFGGQTSESANFYSDRYQFDDQVKKQVRAQTALTVVQICALYRLQLDMPANLQRDSPVSLKVVDKNGKLRTNLHVLYPRRFTDCPPVER